MKAELYVLTHGLAFLLGKARHDRKEYLAFGIQRVYGFLLEIDRNVLAHELPDILEAVEGVSGKSADGFGDLGIVYSRDKGFLNKEKKVVLSVAMTSAGAAEAMARSIPTGGRVIAGIVKLHSVKSQNEDRTGPAQEALVAYTNYMRTLLGEAGYLK